MIKNKNMRHLLLLAVIATGFVACTEDEIQPTFPPVKINQLDSSEFLHGIDGEKIHLDCYQVKFTDNTTGETLYDSTYYTDGGYSLESEIFPSVNFLRIVKNKVFVKEFQVVINKGVVSQLIESFPLPSTTYQVKSVTKFNDEVEQKVVTSVVFESGGTNSPISMGQYNELKITYSTFIEGK